MQRKTATTALVSATLLAGTALAVLQPWRNPYTAYLERRVVALLPSVESELGRHIPRPVRVRVTTIDEITEISEAQTRSLLTAVAEPDVLEGLETTWRPSDALGVVDEEGVVRIDARLFDGADDGGPLWPNWSLRSGPPRLHLIDAVLAHELVHVHQVRERGLFAWAAAARGYSDLLARRAVWEGQATWVAKRVMEREGAADIPAAEALAGPAFGFLGDRDWFEVAADAEAEAFPYRSGARFVEHAVARLGRDEAFRRLFAEPPTMLQVAKPESWPGRPIDTVGDIVARRVRTALSREWTFASRAPYPPTALRVLLRGGPTNLVDAACAAVTDLQRLRARGSPIQASLRGHLIRAVDDEGAATIARAWARAAQARDTAGRAAGASGSAAVLDARWREGTLGDATVWTAERTVRAIVWSGQDAIVAQRGRHVLELRLGGDPSDDQAVVRVARRLLALVADDLPPASVSAASWAQRWRVTLSDDARESDLRTLLSDTDPDVRYGALVRMAADGVLTPEERARALRDPDPLVHLAALTASDDDERLLADVLDALRDQSPWVVAGAARTVRYESLTDALSIDVVERMFTRPERRVRRSASLLLMQVGQWGKWSPAETLRALVTALRDDDPALRLRAAGRLDVVARDTAGLGDAYGLALADARTEIQRAALVILANDGRTVPGVIPHLAAALGTPDGIGALAATALGNAGPDASSALPALHGQAEYGEDTWARLAAETAAARISLYAGHAITALGATLRDGTPNDRRTAAQQARRLGPAARPLAPDLVRMLASNDSSLSHAAQSALLELATRPAETIEILEGLRDLDDGDYHDRVDALIENVESRDARGWWSSSP